MKNLNKYVIVYLCVFMTFGALSQQNPTSYPMIDVKDADTVIIFKIDQAKKLAQFNEERKKLQKVTEIQQKQLSQKDSIINYQDIMIDTYKQIEQSQIVIIDEKTKQLAITKDDNKIISQELKKQKRYKWTAIISGITVNIFTVWIMQKL